MTDYVWGIFTPFIAIGGLALALGAAWLLVAAARILWSKVDYAFMSKVTLRRNRVALRFKGEPEDDRPEYLEAANKFRDALLQSPKVYTLLGFSWRILIVREIHDETEESSVADTDEVLS